MTKLSSTLGFASLSLIVFFLSGCSEKKLSSSEPKTNAPSESSLPEDSSNTMFKVRNVTGTEGESLLKKRPDIVVLDIRTPDEFNEGHIANAINIDFWGDDFSSQLAKLDKNQTYLLHCRSGGRSSSALETFRKKGFSNLIHLNEGIATWPLKLVK